MCVRARVRVRVRVAHMPAAPRSLRSVPFVLLHSSLARASTRGPRAGSATGLPAARDPAHRG